MTHDELLAKINDKIETDEFANTCGEGGWTNGLKALRAVVELHRPEYWQNPNVPEWRGARCTHCLKEQGDYMSPIPVDYPCSTIQAIEKELQ